MCAFSLPTTAQRDELIRRLWRPRVIMLASGPDSVRFRPALTVSRDEIDAARRRRCGRAEPTSTHVRRVPSRRCRDGSLPVAIEMP